MTPWSAARQASLSITISWNLFKLMSIELVMPSNHLLLCRPFFLLPSVFPSIRVFFKESVLRIRWPKDWNFSFSISPSNEYSWLISFRMDWLDLLAGPRDSEVFSNSTIQKHQFFSAQLSLWYTDLIFNSFSRLFWKQIKFSSWLRIPLNLAVDVYRNMYQQEVLVPICVTFRHCAYFPIFLILLSISRFSL